MEIKQRGLASLFKGKLTYWFKKILPKQSKNLEEKQKQNK